MENNQTLIITGSEVAELLNLDDCISAVERAFRLYAEGKTEPPGILGVHAREGGFHIKAGIMDLDRSYFVAKVNANFPQNRRIDLPTIQGVVVVCDANDGRLLALMDSIEITTIRTGAATAVAAKFLARKDSKVVTICGCGNQGRISLKALIKVRPLETVFAFDLDQKVADEFAVQLQDELGVQIKPVTSLKDATLESDICVTCTSSRDPFLSPDDVRPGTFIAAVGADNEDKQELEPSVLKAGKIVVDVLNQAATIGELHHALEHGDVFRSDVHAELGEIIAEFKPGRTNDEEIIIFDSTGMALQDVVAASIVYENALKRGIGKGVRLGE